MVRYTNVPPGSYRFRVRAANDEGVWNQDGALAVVTVKPLFHQTHWFQALVGLGLVLAGFLGQRLRVRRLEARARHLEAVVDERTGDLRTANDELKAAQEQLARLSRNAGALAEDLAVWGPSMAEEVRRAVQAQRVAILRAEGERLVPIGPVPSQPITLSDVLAVDTAQPQEGRIVVPLAGMTREIRGALVIEGTRSFGDTESALVAGLAQHLGSALDFQALRQRLTASNSRQAEVRQRMLEQGIASMNLCPRCGRCYGQEVARCDTDGAELDGTRLLPLLVLGRYRLQRLLGEGGMGSVFAAHDERLARDVALKVIRADRLNDAETRFRLDREARALASVHHPSVVSLFDSGELEDGSAFLAMELLTGTTVAEQLLDCGRATPAQVAALVAQVGSALHAAHRVGVVHRDVKPGNILLVPEGGVFRAKVVDFGVAKSSHAGARLTHTGVLIGTPAYMSPEQVNGEEVDGRSDLYSLAVVAFEALTGRRLVASEDVAKSMIEVLYGAHPPVSSLAVVPPGVDAAFDAALAKRPEDRPTDIETWSQDLAAMLATEPPAAGTGWSVRRS